MDELRKQIDEIDKEIVKLLASRLKCSIDIGNFKKEKGMVIVDEEREGKLLETIKKIASEENIDANYIDRIYKIIIEESRRLQN